ncbi:hypothetical protein [Methanomethylophilus alvi]|uniref:hypothetical protein n=1 Tax=Methanomethylophilus alvi TaxID=1291540 RepID=UPI0037DD6C65
MADSQFVEGLLFAIAGFLTDVLIKAFFFSGDYGTDYGWLFILIGIILIVGSAIGAYKTCDAKGGWFAAGYLVGLVFVH